LTEGLDNGIISNNEIFNCVSSGYGPGNNPIYVSGNNILIEHNYCHDNDRGGLRLGSSHPAVYSNNGVIRSNRCKHQYFGIIAYQLGTNRAIYNNVIWGNTDGSGIRLSNAPQSKVYNNTIYSCSSYGIWVEGGSDASIVKNNLAYQTAGIKNDTSRSTLSNNLTTNPGFVNAGAENFHLQAGSPAIDTGVVIN
jgi:parallel beta-helix repeat protein